MLLFTFLFLTVIVCAAAVVFVIDVVFGAWVLFVMFGDAFACIVIVILIVRFLRRATRKH
jgi:hypothetical protein